MNFSHGVSVISVDGKTAGYIDRVVIDPQTDEITHLVLRRGPLHKADKVVPITTITIGEAGQLTLHLTSNDLELLPDFEAERHTLLDKSE